MLVQKSRPLTEIQQPNTIDGRDISRYGIAKPRDLKTRRVYRPGELDAKSRKSVSSAGDKGILP
jgi:hypothetical protein